MWETLKEISMILSVILMIINLGIKIYEFYRRQ